MSRLSVFYKDQICSGRMRLAHIVPQLGGRHIDRIDSEYIVLYRIECNGLE